MSSPPLRPDGEKPTDLASADTATDLASANTPTLDPKTGGLSARPGQKNHETENRELDHEKDARQQIDDFRILRVLGRGGMAEVLLARDTKLGRKVALKIIAPTQKLNPERVARFLFEARATARFSHPNIVAIYGVGTHAGRPYLVLEYVVGKTLQERIAEGPVELPELLRIALAIVEAMQEAHRNGILHRDLKPQNIILGDDGRLRVLDFGIARLVQPLSSPATPADPGPSATAQEQHIRPVPSRIQPLDIAYTSAGLEDGPNRHNDPRHNCPKGTPRYMAPEQWTDRPASEATDVWALGLILHELAGAGHPYGDCTWHEYKKLVTDEKPLALHPSLITLPATLQQTLRGCIEKDADRRPQVRGIANTLRKLLHPGQVFDIEEGPFRGLSPYDEEDAPMFFGRTAEIERITERLRSCSAVTVVGPSGVGKSSLVRAGLIPRLRERQRVLSITFRPGGDPFRVLAQRLVEQLSGAGNGPPADEAYDEKALPSLLMREPGALQRMLLQISAKHRAQLVVIVDQLEEIFTQPINPATRAAFLESLGRAADDTADPIRVVLTLREDFLGRVANFTVMRTALDQTIVLGLPDRHTLRDILFHTAHSAGFHFEDQSLIDEMLDGVGDETASLPLLQFAGKMLWAHRDPLHHRLTRQGYLAIGGVRGALVQHAEQTLSGTTPEQQSVARAMLLRLVSGQTTRRTCTTTELNEDLPVELARDVFARLEQGRLIVVRQAEVDGSAPGEDAIELVHEWLISSWPRLARWIEGARVDLRLLRELEQASQTWMRRDEAPEGLWQGRALEEASQAIQNSPHPVGALCRRFVEQGLLLRRRRARRRRQQIIAVAFAASMVVVGALLAALVINAARNESARQRDVARVQELRARTEARKAQREAQSARRARRRISEQLRQIKAEEAARQAAENRAQKATAAVFEGKHQLKLTGKELRRALSRSRASETRVRALLAKERARNAALERARKRIGTKLPR